MSFKLAFLFVVCFLALAGAIPIEKPEEVEDTKDAPVAAEPEKEAAEETSDPEEKEEEEEEESPSEDQEAEQEENDTEDKQDEEEPETADAEEEPENEVEAKEDDVNDPTPGRRYSSYHPKCKYIKKKVRRCYYKLRCKGSYYKGYGRCCRKIRYCRYVWVRVRKCQVCKRKCRRICGYRYRKVCQPRWKCVWKTRRIKRRRAYGYGYYYQTIRYRKCKLVTKCQKLRYKYCVVKCYGYICRYRG